MKTILNFFLALLLVSAINNIKLQAQLFESVPLDFGVTAGQFPGIMYYDSIDEISYITGMFRTVNDTACNVVKYDGTNYMLMPLSPLIENTYAIMRYKDKIYFGGRGGLVTWDGSNWEMIESNLRCQIGNLIVHEDKLYAMGSFDSIAGQKIGMVAVWNDTTWSDLYRIDTLLNRSSSDGISSIAFYKGNVYVAGNFSNSYHPDLVDLMMCDGEKWMNVGGFMLDGLSSVNNLIVWEDDLYVGGSFMKSSGSPGNAIAKWDGVNWHSLGEGLMRRYPAVYGMIKYKNELYMAGSFEYMNGVYLGADFRGFAKWDGSQWCSMGLHTNNLAFGLGTWKDELFIMGGFKVVNGDSIQYMTKWIGGNYTEFCSTPTSIENTKPDLQLSIAPNPTTGAFHIRFYNNSIQAPYTIQITNVLGSVVYTNKHTAHNGFNNIESDLKHVSSGVYFLNISGENINSTVKLIKK